MMTNKLTFIKSINNTNSHKTSLLTEMFSQIYVTDAARKSKINHKMGQERCLHGHMI